jgi:alkylhydroperoxidase family enzyme
VTPASSAGPGWAEERKALLGAEHVVTDAAALDAASTATFKRLRRSGSYRDDLFN